MERMISKIFIDFELDFLRDVTASMRETIGNMAYPKISEYVGDIDKFTTLRFTNNKRKDDARMIKL